MSASLVWRLLASATVVVVACSSPPRWEPIDAAPVNPGRADGPVQPGSGGSMGTGGTAGSGEPTGGTGGTGSQPDPGCQPGFHPCSGVCVDNTKPQHCVTACEPCPTVMGGMATCDGVKCGVMCPMGQKPCLDKCVDMASACDGNCPAGQNACNGICVDAKSLAACGRACTPCPTSPNGATTCDGDKCDLMCNAGHHRCEDKCVSDADVATCGVSCTPCQVPKGGEATCQAGQCGGRCPADKQLCLGECVPTGQACDGRCPQGKHNCNNTCVPDTDVNSCGSTNCMPCSAPANGKATCVNGSCDFDCTTGRKCNGKCVTAENCANGADDDCDGKVDCADSKCAAGTNCGTNSVCRNSTCVQLKERGDTCSQTSECRAGTCVTGHCCNPGEKFCDGQCQAGGYCCNGTSCPITNGTGSCMGGDCQRTGCNSGYKPQGTNQCVDVCSGVTCGACQSCSNGQCAANDSKGGCSGCDRCQSGRCESRCTSAQHCEGTTCVNNCTTTSCNTGNPCTTGTTTCPPTTCVVAKANPGASCGMQGDKVGTCNGSGGCDFKCPPSQPDESNGHCCPRGLVYVSGSCRTPCSPEGKKECKDDKTLRQCSGGAWVEMVCPGGGLCYKNVPHNPDIPDPRCGCKPSTCVCGSDGQIRSQCTQEGIPEHVYSCDNFGGCSPGAKLCNNGFNPTPPEVPDYYRCTNW